MLRCQSGRMCRSRKPMYRKVPRVQIPLSAPIKDGAGSKNLLYFLMFFAMGSLNQSSNFCWRHTAPKVLPALAKNMPLASCA